MLTAVMIKGFKFSGPYSPYFSFVDTDFSIYNSHKFIIHAPTWELMEWHKTWVCSSCLEFKIHSKFAGVHLSGFSGRHPGY